MRKRTMLVVTVLTALLLVPAASQADEYTGPTIEYGGHHYALVDAGVQLTWQQAKAAAEALTYTVVDDEGKAVEVQGHLATVTPAEYMSVIQLSDSWLNAWVGAQFDHQAVEWKWITGETLPMDDPNWPPVPWVEQDDPITDPDQDVLQLDFAAHTPLFEGWWSWHNTLTERYYIVEFEPPPNGHHYALVDAGVQLTWQQAKAAAEALTYTFVGEYGSAVEVQGHLATVTPAEYMSVIQLSDSWLNAWVGARFDHQAVEWKWITGETLPMDDPNWPPVPWVEQDDPITDPDQDVLQLDFAAHTPLFEGWWSWHNTLTERYYIVEFEPPLLVDVDIKPGSETNPVNLPSRGMIQVAILTVEDFDAFTVDPLTVRFGPGAAPEAHGKGHFDDVDADGDIDLMLHFRTQETGIEPGDAGACLTGETYAGDIIVGCDTVTVKAKKT